MGATGDTPVAPIERKIAQYEAVVGNRFVTASFCCQLLPSVGKVTVLEHNGRSGKSGITA
jgi:hypothetical protein